MLQSWMSRTRMRGKRRAWSGSASRERRRRSGARRRRSSALFWQSILWMKVSPLPTPTVVLNAGRVFLSVPAPRSHNSELRLRLGIQLQHELMSYLPEKFLFLLFSKYKKMKIKRFYLFSHFLATLTFLPYNGVNKNEKTT
jgi:hypothetical protein